MTSSLKTKIYIYISLSVNELFRKQYWHLYKDKLRNEMKKMPEQFQSYKDYHLLGLELMFLMFVNDFILNDWIFSTCDYFWCFSLQLVISNLYYLVHICFNFLLIKNLYLGTIKMLLLEKKCDFKMSFPKNLHLFFHPCHS